MVLVEEWADVGNFVDTDKGYNYGNQCNQVQCDGELDSMNKP